MSTDYSLVKKYRFDEWFHPASRTTVGLYLHPSRGTFYAFVPETKTGRLFSAETKYALLRLLETEGASLLSPEWTRILVLTLPPPVDGMNLRWMQPNQAPWAQTRPDRAGVVVGLGVEVFDVSTTSNGERVHKEVHLDLPDEFSNGTARPLARYSISGERVETAFTPEAYALAMDLRDRLRGLNHSLRTALYADDPLVALATAMAHLPDPADPNPVLPPAEGSS
jgi:hypothetical protein